MKMTIDFYTRILGMPLVHAFKVPPGTSRGNPPFERIRHYFFDAGGDTLLGFFELPKGAKPKGDRNAIAAMQHCSFTTTEQRFKELVERMRTAGLELTGPLFVGVGCWSVYFYDPNGIRLEFTYQMEDGEDVRVIERFTQTSGELLEELRTLYDDEAWLEEMSGHLPKERPASSHTAG